MVNLAEHRTDNPEQGNPKEKLSTRNKLIAAFGAGAVSVAAIFGVTHAMGNDEKSVPQENSATYDTPPPSVDVNGNPITSETVKPEIKIATGEILKLLQEHSKNLDEWRGLTLDILKRNKLLSPEEQSFLESNYATLSEKADKSTYTDNEILAVTALDRADVSSQDDYSIGHAMLPLINSKKSTDFNDLNLKIGNGKGALIDVFQQNGSSLKHPTNTFLDEDLQNTKDTRVIVQSKILGINGRTEVLVDVGVYALNSDGQGNEQWQQKERYDLNYNGLQTALDSLRS